jgi:hypothetical protein
MGQLKRPYDKEAKEPFKCPLCGCPEYVAITAQLEGGQWWRLPFYRCFGCTAMFDDPRSFTRRTWSPPKPPGGFVNFGMVPPKVDPKVRDREPGEDDE